MSEAEQVISLADGGIVTVLLAKDIEMPAAFRDHPRVRVLEAHGMSVLDLEQVLVANSRGLIMAGRLRQELYAELQDLLKRRHHPWIYRPNPTALEAELRRMLVLSPPPPPPAPGADPAEGKLDRTQVPKGYWSMLIEKHGGIDPTKSTTEEGRRLMALAQAEGYVVTLAAVAQGVHKYRKDHQLGERPKSAMSPRLQVLKLLDDTLAGFTLLREYVEHTESENVELKRRLEKKTKALRDALDE